MTPDRVFSDGELFEFDRSGRMFKAYGPSRQGACVRLQDGLFRFDLQKGDLCLSIDKNRKDAPNRNMIAGFGPTSRMAPGGRMGMRFGVLIEPPTEGALRSWHLNIGQIQATSDAGEYSTPPMSIEVLPISLTGPHKVQIEATTLPGRSTAGSAFASRIIGSAAFEVGKVNWFDVEFADSLGRSGGLIKVAQNGTIIANETGPTSFDNEAGVYPGWGLYRNPVEQTLVSYLVQPEYGAA